MAVNMIKGQTLSLTTLIKDVGAALQRITVACGWDVNAEAEKASEEDFDLDLSCAGLSAKGKLAGSMDPRDKKYQEWFIYANHRKPSNDSVEFMGDNRTGKGPGDDELINVDLLKVPGDVECIRFGVVIWDGQKRQQRFGDVQNAFIRVFDRDTKHEFARFNLGADFSDETFVVFGELYRLRGEWKFRAIGQGYDAATYRNELGITRPFETEYARFRN